MTSAGADAGTGQAGQAGQGAVTPWPPDAGGGAPDPAQASPGLAAEQPGQPPAASPPDAASQPDAARQAPPGPALSEQSREDTDIAWGEYRSRDDEDRDRLYRDRPPHWADY